MASFVQALASGVTTADQSLAFSSDVSAGSLLVVCMREGTNPTGSPTITDSRANSWSIAQRTVRATIAYAVASSSGPCTVTVDAMQAISTRLVIMEFSGSWSATPLDVVATSIAVGSSPVTANAVTPSAPNGVAVSLLSTVSDANPFAITAGGYTLGPVAGVRVAPAYRTFSAIAPYAPTYTAGALISNDGDLQNVAFIETASGGGGNAPAAIARYRRLCGVQP